MTLVECASCGAAFSKEDITLHTNVCHFGKLREQRKTYFRDGLQTLSTKPSSRSHPGKWRIKGPKHPVTTRRMEDE